MTFSGEDGTVRYWNTDTQSISHSIDIPHDPKSLTTAKMKKRATEVEGGEIDDTRLKLSDRPTVYSMSVSKDKKWAASIRKTLLDP